MAGPDDIPLPNLKGGAPGLDLDFAAGGQPGGIGEGSEGGVSKVAEDLEHVFDVPVNVSAVLGRTRLEIGDLLKLGPGTVLELDRKVGEAIDIFVNDRLVARGEVVLVDERLGVTMTEIIKAER
ncbi:flagellar motor switch protein FliN [Alsobacter sp. R-9]